MPAATTSPETTSPGIVHLGLKRPMKGRAMSGSPLRRVHATAETVVACTLTRTSSSPKWGKGTSLSSSTAAEPYVLLSIAFMSSMVKEEPSDTGDIRCEHAPQPACRKGVRGQLYWFCHGVRRRTAMTWHDARMDVMEKPGFRVARLLLWWPGMTHSSLAATLTALTVTGLSSAAMAADLAPPAEPAPATDQQSTTAQSPSGAPAAGTPSATVPATPAAGPKPPEQKPCQGPWDKDGIPWIRLHSDAFGLRGTMTRLHGVTGDNEWGMAFWAAGEQYENHQYFSTRGAYRLGIGGGGAGFEGALHGNWAGGIRIPLGADQGPVIRLGLNGTLQGNNRYYASLLELPQLQIGYQYLHGQTLVELGAKSGAVLVGRDRIGDANRKLGEGLEYGAYASLQLPWLTANAELTRLPGNDAVSAPVNVAEGRLCGRAAPLAICADARACFTKAALDPADPDSRVRSVYAGLLLGFSVPDEPKHKQPKGPPSPPK